MISKNVVVNNAEGIHCRPSSRIMQKVLEYEECSFFVKTAKGETDLSSILELISLGLERGDEVIITVNGKNEEKVCCEIAALFSFNFDFPPRI
jgi:phosphotransferase system HPr (HPr) family protein